MTPRDAREVSKDVPRRSEHDAEVERRPGAIRYAWGLLADVAPGRDLVGELIAEHRAEARAEDEDDAREGTGSGGRA